MSKEDPLPPVGQLPQPQGVAWCCDSQTTLPVRTIAVSYSDLTLKDHCSAIEGSILLVVVIQANCKMTVWKPWKDNSASSNVVFQGELGCIRLVGGPCVY